eukprot:290014_1
MSTQCLEKLNRLIHIFGFPLYVKPEWIKGCYSDYPLQSIEYIKQWLARWPHTATNDLIKCGVIQQIIHLLKNNNYKYQILCCGYIRELSLHYQIPQEIIKFIERLCDRDYHINDKVQINGRWILCSIAAATSEQTKYILKHDAISILMDGIKQDTSISVKIPSIQALGNIAGDEGTVNRDLILSYNIISQLLPYCNPHSTQQHLSLQRNIAWTLSNLCRQKPVPKRKYIKLAMKAFSILILNNDAEILQDTCWGYSYISDGPSYNQIDWIVQSGIVSRFIELLEHNESNVIHPTLRTIGNIVTSDDNHTQSVINYGVLNKLYILIKHTNIVIKRETCWTISNITAGSVDQIEAVISANLCKPLINILNTQPFEIAREALWAISNATSGANCKQISFLVNQGVIQALFKYIEGMNNKLVAKMIMVMLEAIENILDAGRRLCEYGNCENKFVKYVKEIDGVNCLKQLQSNQMVSDKIEESLVDIDGSCYLMKQQLQSKQVVSQVCEKVNGIIEKYFNE